MQLCAQRGACRGFSRARNAGSCRGFSRARSAGRAVVSAVCAARRPPSCPATAPSDHTRPAPTLHRGRPVSPRAEDLVAEPRPFLARAVHAETVRLPATSSDEYRAVHHDNGNNKNKNIRISVVTVRMIREVVISSARAIDPRRNVHGGPDVSFSCNPDVKRIRP